LINRESHDSIRVHGFCILLSVPAYYFLLFKGGTFLSPFSWPVTLVAHTLLSAAGLLVLQRFKINKFRYAGGFIDVSLLVIFIFLLFQVFLSSLPRYSIYTFVMFILHVTVFYFFLQNMRSHEDWVFTLRMICFGAAGVSLYSLTFYLSGHSVRASMPLGHHNLLGGYLVLTIPLCFGLYRREVGRAGFNPSSFVWLAATFISVAALLASGSMGSLISFLFSTLVTVVISQRSVLLDGGRMTSVLRKKTPVIFLKAVICFASIVLCFRLLPVFRETGIRILNLVLGGADTSVLFRYQIYKSAMNGILDKPVFGSGLGLTPFFFPLFKWQVPTAFSPGQTVAQLHNTYLHLGFELGLTGLILVLVLQSHLLLNLLKSVRNVDPNNASSGNGMKPYFLASLSGYSLNALTDSQLHVPAVTITLTLVVVLSLRTALAAPKAHRKADFPYNYFVFRGRRSLLWLILCGCLLFWAISFIVKINTAGYYYYSALKGIERNEDAETLINDLERACKVDPDFGFYHFELGYFLEIFASSLEITGEHHRASVLISEAVKEMEIAEDLNPYSSIYLVHAGGLLYRLNQYEKALEKLRTAGALDYYSPFPAFYSGMSLHSLGRDDEAVVEFTKAIKRFPRLVFASYWQEGDNGRILRNVLESLRKDSRTNIVGANKKELVYAFFRKFHRFQSRLADPGESGPPATRIYMQKNDLDDRPYSLYVFKKKGLVIYSAPINIFEIFENNRLLDKPFSAFLEPGMTAKSLRASESWATISAF